MLQPLVIDEYYKLLDSVTTESERLFKICRSQVKCRPGCYFCCDDIALLPIEYNVVKLRLDRYGWPGSSVLREPLEKKYSGSPFCDNADRERQLSINRSSEGRLAGGGALTGKYCGFLGKGEQSTIYAARTAICSISD